MNLTSCYYYCKCRKAFQVIFLIPSNLPFLCISKRSKFLKVLWHCSLIFPNNFLECLVTIWIPEKFFFNLFSNGYILIKILAVSSEYYHFGYWDRFSIEVLFEALTWRKYNYIVFEWSLVFFSLHFYESFLSELELKMLIWPTCAGSSWRIAINGRTIWKEEKWRKFQRRSRWRRSRRPGRPPSLLVFVFCVTLLLLDLLFNLFPFVELSWFCSNSLETWSFCIFFF